MILGHLTLILIFLITCLNSLENVDKALSNLQNYPSNYNDDNYGRSAYDLSIVNPDSDNPQYGELNSKSQIDSPIYAQHIRHNKLGGKIKSDTNNFYANQYGTRKKVVHGIPSKRKQNSKRTGRPLPQHQNKLKTKQKCKLAIGGKFCKDFPIGYPKGAEEISTFGKSQSGRSVYIVEDPIYTPPVVNFCKEVYEFLSPKWAINTRGEGQYIVQTPDYVQKVLFRTCRPGYGGGQGSQCSEYGSCQQQYTLIQLRVYDDIFGVFADWFQIPAGCECRF